MVAIDESDCSHYALVWALENLKETISCSELVIFCVQSLVNLGFVYGSFLGASRKSPSMPNARVFEA